MSAAILFYGYNLGAPDDSGWAIENEENFQKEWFDSILMDEGYAEVMRSRILEESGLVPLRDFTPVDSEEKLAARCGVQIVSYGHSNTMFYGLALAGTVCEADDWSPKHVAPVVSGDAARLREALESMEMRPTQVNPSWILAPQE